MKNELHGEYRKDFNFIQKYIKREVVDCDERTSVIEDLYDLYVVSQNEGMEISQIHEEKTEDYVFELISSIPKKTPAYKRKKALVFLSIILAFFMLSFLAAPENLTKNQGFYYVSKNTEKFDMFRSGETYPDVWKFEVNGNVFSVIEESKSESYKNIFINKFYLSEDGENIYMTGKTKALFQNKTSGKIIIPIFTLATYDIDISDKINSLLNYNPDKYVPYNSEPNQILFDNYIYNGKITKYRFNIDGSVDFEIVYTKSFKKETKDNNLIYWDCCTFEWDLIQ